LINIPLRLILLPILVSSMAFYLCCRIWKGYGLKPAIIWAAVSASIISWGALITRVFSINTPPELAVVGYAYLVFTGLSFMLLLTLDTIGFILWCLLKIKINVRHKLSLVFIVTSTIFCSGYFEARDIRTVEISVTTDKLPIGTDTIRIVQISDLHISKTFDSDQLTKTMEIADAASADLIILTGDTVDMDLRKDEYFVKILDSVSTPLGKYAVTGNHEHYAGIEQAADFMERAGYTVLRGGWLDLGPIVVAGIDDPGRDVVSKQNDGFLLLSSLPDNLRSKFILFLKHQPYVHEDSIGLFDLQLSGHTHGGQIWPLGYLVGFLHGIKQGLSAHADSHLYVSNGTGYWGPPIRFLAPPEVTIINVVRKQQT